MNNTNQVLVTVRPVGDWIKTTEKAVASGASVCLQTLGFEEHIEELWNHYLAKFRTGIFAVSCKDFKTAKALQAIAELNGSALTRSLRVIIPWHRVSREQIV